jgi:LPXTG-site transpeptidase (sortase) family protein
VKRAIHNRLRPPILLGLLVTACAVPVTPAIFAELASALDQGAFAELQYATYGTEIIYQTADEAVVYTVNKISRVPPDAIEELFLSDGNSILLITCTDWQSASRTYENRLIVRATRVEVKDY